MSARTPVYPGSPIQIQASDWNALLKGIEPRQNGGGSPLGFQANVTTLKCRNDAGEDLKRFAVVSIEDPLFTVDDAIAQGSEDYFAFEPVMKAHKPDWRKGWTWGLTTEPIAEDDVGSVLLAGLTPVRLVGHRHLMVCGPDTITQDTGTLKTGRGDCPVIWQQVGEDAADESEHWGLVWLGGPQVDIEGEIVTEGTPPDSDGKVEPTACEMKAWRLQDGQNLSDSPRLMETIDKAIQCMNRDPSLSPIVGAYCRARWINGEWRLVWVGCP